MTSLRLLLAAATVPFLFACSGSQHIDSRYPTVSQQDALDQSWGMPPRKSRGNPKLRYQYDARTEAPPVGASAAPAAPAPVAPIPAAPAPLPQETVSPAIPSNIR